MTNQDPGASHGALAEALQLSEEILRDLELQQAPLTGVAFKTARLARLLNDSDHQKLMTWEAGGYPSEPTMSAENWRLAGLAGRQYWAHAPDDLLRRKEKKKYAYVESIAQLEDRRVLAERSLAAVGESSPQTYGSNQIQWDARPYERSALHEQALTASKRIAERRTFIYGYVLEKHYQLKFSGVADDVFTRTRRIVDAQLGMLVPQSLQKFAAIYDNLRSTNSEDWSNAVHGCRRVLQDLADSVFPATDPRTHASGKVVKLGADNYINRIIAFAEDNAGSKRFVEIVGSNLAYLGNRLDAIFEAAQKGSHSTIVTRDEADRYVVYTYMLVGDILGLRPTDDATKV